MPEAADQKLPHLLNDGPASDPPSVLVHHSHLIHFPLCPLLSCQSQAVEGEGEAVEGEATRHIEMGASPTS